MIADAERSVAILTRLKAVGVRISIDDYGSGYSSLAQMRRFPIDELKIDRPFVAGMLDDPGDRAVVRSVIDIGHHFGLAVVGEGVETREQREALAALGCDLAQGRAVSGALPPAVFREWWGVHASGA
jgi:EAL domain-containing protein (putative c-di-GMP-specific phosphodiesterase class I)